MAKCERELRSSTDYSVTVCCALVSTTTATFLQDGLEPIRERVFAEVVLQYGFREEFMGAEAATMSKLLECVKER